MSYDAEKHNTITALFKQGKTASQIATLFSVSRQRISQILAARGVSKREGGQHLRIATRDASEKVERERKHLERYGCTAEQFRSVRGDRKLGSKSPYQAFHNQSHNAGYRGVPWRLTFWEWWQVWAESGKWEERGRGVTGYCMCRNGDEGAYEAGNVYIGTVIHNSTLGRTLAFERTERRKPFYHVIHSAGGRKKVAERLGIDRQYVSQLAVNGKMPNCWVEDGRAEILSSMTCGAYSAEDLLAFTTSGANEIHKESA